MLIKMINSVIPNEYGMKGQYGWADEVQYHTGREYDLSPEIADAMIYNGDAVGIIGLKQILNDVYAPDTFEQLAKLNNYHNTGSDAELAPLPNPAMSGFRAGKSVCDDGYEVSDTFKHLFSDKGEVL